MKKNRIDNQENISDGEIGLLIRKIKTGDVSALEELIKRLDPLLIKLSTRYSFSVDEDCYQELVLKLISSIKKFEIL